MQQNKNLGLRKTLLYLAAPLGLMAIVWALKTHKPTASRQALSVGGDELGSRALGFDDVEERVALSWAPDADEATTLVITSASPSYIVLLLRRPDDSLEVVRSKILIGEEREQRMSLGRRAYAGTYCAFSAATPAELETLLTDLDHNPPPFTCAERLEEGDAHPSPPQELTPPSEDP